MRVLAVSTPEPIDVAGKQVKTLKQQGLDVEITNWRGIVAPPDVSPEDTACIVQMMQQMHDSPAWQETLAKYSWQDLFVTGDEYAEILTSERERVIGILTEIGLVSE